MSEPTYTPQSPPRVIIVGAGIAGVFLGILLDRANIPYDIFERAPSVKQLGTLHRSMPLYPLLYLFLFILHMLAMSRRATLTHLGLFFPPTFQFTSIL